MKFTDSHIKYAKALLNLASRLGNEDRVLEQLGELTRLFHEPKFLHLIKNFSYMDPKKGQAILAEVFKTHLEPIVFNLLVLLFLNRKFALLPRINQIYRKLYHLQKGIADITLVTARTLSDEEKEEFEKLISLKRAKAVSVSYEHNPALVGGVQYYEEGYLTDLSIQNYLQTLKKQLLSDEIH